MYTHTHTQGGQEMLIVMEYMARGSLSDVLNDRTIPLSEAVRVTMAIEAARGVAVCVCVCVCVSVSVSVSVSLSVFLSLSLSLYIYALGVHTGMVYLHTLKPPVLHRDLKSPNLLVDAQV